MTIKERRTMGAKWFETDKAPASINPEIKGAGIIRWTDDVRELTKMLEGLEDPSVVISNRDLWRLPMKGLTIELGEQIDIILGEVKPRKGAIVINEPLRLRAAWLDDEYWPNTEKGGH